MNQLEMMMEERAYCPLVAALSRAREPAIDGRCGGAHERKERMSDGGGRSGKGTASAFLGVVLSTPCQIAKPLACFQTLNNLQADTLRYADTLNAESSMTCHLIQLSNSTRKEKLDLFRSQKSLANTHYRIPPTASAPFSILRPGRSGLSAILLLPLPKCTSHPCLASRDPPAAVPVRSLS